MTYTVTVYFESGMTVRAIQRADDDDDMIRLMHQWQTCGAWLELGQTSAFVPAEMMRRCVTQWQNTEPAPGHVAPPPEMVTRVSGVGS